MIVFYRMVNDGNCFNCCFDAGVFMSVLYEFFGLLLLGLFLGVLFNLIGGF